MKLKFTRKTWYFFLLAAAAMSMLGGFAVLGGMDFSGLELIVFCITGSRRFLGTMVYVLSKNCTSF